MKASMRTFLNRLTQAQPWQAVLESALLTALLVVGLGFVLNPASKYASGNGLLLTAGLGGFWACLRARSFPGSLLMTLAREGLLALSVTVGLYTAFMLGGRMVGHNQIITAALGDSGWLVPGIAGMAGFPGLRALRYLYELWDRQHKRHYYWELANAMMLVVLLLMTVLWAIAFLFAGSNPLLRAGAENANLFESLLDRLLTQLFPGTMMLVLIVLGALAAVLPPFALFSYWVARRLTRRLDALGKAAAQMRSGDLSTRVPVDGQDELSQLQMAFNEMAANLQTTTADLQRERDKLAALLESQRQLTASVSHELRTPVATLARLSGIEPAMPGRFRRRSKQRRTLEIMEQETARLQTLIEDLLTLSRAEVNALTLNLNALDVRPVIEQVVRATAPLAWQSHRVEISASLPPELSQCLRRRDPPGAGAAQPGAERRAAHPAGWSRGAAGRAAG